MRNEWARTGDDVLWRRSKLGLHLAPTTVQALRDALGEVEPWRDIGTGAAKAGGGGE